MTKTGDNGHLENGSGPDLLLCGISHNSASLAEREQFQLNRHEIPKALKIFLSLDGVTEVVLLSTCNRFEAYFCAVSQKRSFDIVRQFYRKIRKIDILPYEHLFYSKHASSVVRHLCMVTSAMDSLVLGETQIVGQVRESYSLACSLKTPDRILHKVFHTAFRAGKVVRNGTVISKGLRSVAGEGVAILKQKIVPEDQILIIGVNQNTKLAAKCLFDAGYKNMVFVNRDLYKAEKLATRFGVSGFSLDNVQEHLNQSRALISCTGAPEFIISSEQINEWRKNKKDTLFIVDMAMPRDVDTTNLTGQDIFVIDLQDLKNYLEIQNLERKAHFPIAEQLIKNEVRTFQAWLETANDPLLGYIAEQFEKIRRRNLDECLQHFSEDDKDKVEKFSLKLVRQMLSVPKKYLEKNSKNKKSVKRDIKK